VEALRKAQDERYRISGINRAGSIVQCFTLAGTNKKRGIFGSGKAQTAAIPGGIARICNTARAEKTLFYVPDSVKHCR
jgi:hypothetical protein